jgi:hypothetical protein
MAHYGIQLSILGEPGPVDHFRFETAIASPSRWLGPTEVMLILCNQIPDIDLSYKSGWFVRRTEVKRKLVVT